jgi:hypothetical protein
LIPDSAKNDEDGSVKDKFAENLQSWSSMNELKCIYDHCSKKFKSPFELLLHNRAVHKGQNEKVFKCPSCPAGDDSKEQRFDFCQFFQHTVDAHQSYLRFCCVVCSKMFFNLSSLLEHYVDTHRSFSFLVCLYDGLLFKTLQQIKDHIKSDECKGCASLTHEKVNNNQAVLPRKNANA